MTKHCSVARTAGVSEEQLNVIGGLWKNIQQAVRRVHKKPSATQLWYSFMQAGNHIREDTGNLIETTGFETAGLTKEDVLMEFQSAFVAISDLFTAMFSKTYSPHAFVLNLLPRVPGGEETGIKLPSDFFFEPYSLLDGPGLEDNIGDLRVAMVPVNSEGFTLACAHTPSTNPAVMGDVGGDSRFDQAEQWRLDTETKSGHTSLKYVAIHEFLHNLGMGHDPSSHSFLRPAISTSESVHDLAPGGLLDSEEYFTVHKAYAGSPFIVGLHGDRIYRVSGSTNVDPIANYKRKWKGVLQSIAVSPSGYIFGTNKKHAIYFRKNISEIHPYGSGFTRLSGSLCQISAGVLVLGVNKRNIPYLRVGVTAEQPAGTGWSRIFGQKLSFITCSPAANPQGRISVMGLFKGRPYFRVGVTFSNVFGTGWQRLTGPRIKHVVIGWFGKLIFGVTTHNRVVRRVGITIKNPSGTQWQSLSGDIKIKNLALSPTGELYAVGTNQKLYYRLGMKTTNLNGSKWKSVKIGKVDFLSIGFQI